MKHAYCIIAHNNLEQLQRLLLLLDDPRNDIYIHIDKKSNLDMARITPPRMKYSYIEYCDRIDIRWGHVSQVEAELKLFELASKTYHSYYHLISGVDMPLHSQDFIHDYFSGKNYEYIGFAKCCDARNDVLCHNILMRNMRNSNTIVRCVVNGMRKLFNKMQIMVGYCVKQPNYTFVKGCNWCSVTHDFVQALLANKNLFLKMYRYSYCPDEKYKQTFAFNSNFRSRIFDIEDEFRGCMREIDWKRGRPYTWLKDDYNYLASSCRLFGRKFDMREDGEIIDMLINKIRNEHKS